MSDTNYEWPPHQSAIDVQDGETARGSTGQLFVAKNGCWVRATKAFEDELDARIAEMKSQKTDANTVRNMFLMIGIGFALLVGALIMLARHG